MAKKQVQNGENTPQGKSPLRFGGYLFQPWGEIGDFQVKQRIKEDRLKNLWKRGQDE